MILTHEKETFHLEKRHHAALILFLWLLLTFNMSACGGFHPSAWINRNFDFNVTVAKNANRNSPIAVNLVLIFDEDLVKKLSALTSREWFKQRDQFKQDFPGDTGFSSLEWEWIPNQNVSPLSLPTKSNLEAVIIFANYTSKGAHRAQITPNSDIKLKLLEEGFQVEMS